MRSQLNSVSLIHWSSPRLQKCMLEVLWLKEAIAHQEVFAESPGHVSVVCFHRELFRFFSIMIWSFLLYLVLLLGSRSRGSSPYQDPQRLSSGRSFLGSLDHSTVRRSYGDERLALDRLPGQGIYPRTFRGLGRAGVCPGRRPSAGAALQPCFSVGCGIIAIGCLREIGRN